MTDEPGAPSAPIYELRFTIYDFGEFAREARSCRAIAERNFREQECVDRRKAAGQTRGVCLFTIYDFATSKNYQGEKREKKS